MAPVSDGDSFNGEVDAGNVFAITEVFYDEGGPQQ
jgi:hypothetical protein